MSYIPTPTSLTYQVVGKIRGTMQAMFFSAAVCQSAAQSRGDGLSRSTLHHCPVKHAKYNSDKIMCLPVKKHDVCFMHQVNGINVEACTHDEVVTLLKQAEGPVITLAVRHFRPASHFLNKSKPFQVCLTFPQQKYAISDLSCASSTKVSHF